MPRPRPLRGRCADVPPQDNRRDKAPAAELVALVGQGPGAGGVASRLSGDEIDRLASDPISIILRPTCLGKYGTAAM